MALPTPAGLLSFLIWAGTREGPLIIPKALFEQFKGECANDSALLGLRETEDEYVVFFEGDAELTPEQVELLAAEPAGSA